MRLTIITLSLLSLLSTTVGGVQAATVDTKMLSDLQADLAQRAGLTGQGVTVGVISLGIEGYAQAEASGDLPPSIGIVGNTTGTGNEGLAMLEIVHQIAPGATLAFCSVYTAALVSQCAQELVTDYHVNIVVDDIAFFGGEQAVFAPTPDSFNYDTLLAANPSLIAVHASGDSQQESFGGLFVGTPLVIGASTYQVEDFGKAAGGASTPYETVTVAPGQTINPALYTNQDPENPPPASNDNFGLWVLSTSGAVLASAQSQVNVFGVVYTNTGSATVTVNLLAGLVTQNNANPVAIVLLLLGPDVAAAQYPPTLPINGGGFAGDQLAGSAGVLSIAAVNEYPGPLFGVAQTANAIASYSSVGPVTLYWSATQTGNFGGVPILSFSPLAQPLVLHHPELAGLADETTGSGGLAGTSAAAPTVAGVMALMLQAGYAKAQIMTSLEATAAPVPAPGGVQTGQSQGTWNPIDGYGLVQVWSALLNAGLAVPSPVINGPTLVNGTVGQSLSFSGDCGAPAGQSITGYSWSYGDGGTANTQSATHTFTTAGSYAVTFTCTDSQGYTNPEPATVTVNITGTATPPPSSGGSSGGGGAFGLLAIVLLIGLLVDHRLRSREHLLS